MRVAGHQRQAAEQRERVQPGERAAGEGAVDHLDALDEGAQHDALGEGRRHGAAGEGPVPPVAIARWLLKRNSKATPRKISAEQHDRSAAGRRRAAAPRRRAGRRANSAAPPSTSQVSLPSQTGATVFIITSRSASSGANGNRMPIAEVETVHDHVHDHAERDDAGPDQRQVDAPSASLPRRRRPDRRIVLERLRQRPRSAGCPPAGSASAAPRSAWCASAAAGSRCRRRTRRSRPRRTAPARSRTLAGGMRRDRIGRAHQAVDDPGLAADARW